MGSTRAEGFEPCILRWEAKDGTENVSVGNANENQVREKERDYKETIDSIDTDVSTGQLCNAHVLTVGMSYYSSLTKGQAVDEIDHGKCE